MASWKAHMAAKREAIVPSSSAASALASSAPEPSPSAAVLAVLPEPVLPSASSSSSSSAASAAPAAPAAAVVVDINKLHASLLRAKMLGDTAKVALLEAQIAAAPPLASAKAEEQPLKRARVEGPSVPAPSGPVIVSTLDARGLPIPSLQAAPHGLTRDDIRSGSRAGKVSGGQANLLGPSGERLGYFAEEVGAGGSSSSSSSSSAGAGAAAGSAAIAAAAARVRAEAAALARRDAAEGGESLSARLARNIAGDSRYRQEGLRADGSGRGEGEDDSAQAAALLAARDAGLTARERQSRDMARAVAAHKEGEAALARCPLCAEGGGLREELVVARGKHCMLLLPPQGQRFPGHMLIAPIAHVAAATDMVSWGGGGAGRGQRMPCRLLASTSPRATLTPHTHAPPPPLPPF